MHGWKKREVEGPETTGGGKGLKVVEHSQGGVNAHKEIVVGIRHLRMLSKAGHALGEGLASDRASEGMATEAANRRIVAVLHDVVARRGHVANEVDGLVEELAQVGDRNAEDGDWTPKTWHADREDVVPLGEKRAVRVVYGRPSDPAFHLRRHTCECDGLGHLLEAASRQELHRV